MNKKEERLFIHQLYQGHCAYCGSPVEIQEMQVDHFLPLRRGKKNGLERDSIENKKPACRPCNHYKSGLLPENFRKVLKKLHIRLTQIYHIRVAKAYQLIEIRPFDGKFYFEKYSLPKDIVPTETIPLTSNSSSLKLNAVKKPDELLHH